MAYNEEVTMMMSVVPGAMTGISTMMSGLVSINNVFLDMTRQLDASFGLIDTSIITASTIVAQFGIEAAKAAGEFEQGLKVAQMVSGQTAQDMDYLRNKANELSVSFRTDIDQITEGLQTLGRAGLNSAAEQTEVLENGLSTAKLEGRDLNGVLEELIQNTALLGGNLKSSSFGEDSQYVNDLLVATSMTAPITTHDVSETLKYSGGIAAAAGARIRDEQGAEDTKGKEILEDYMGAIAAFAQKGVTGSIAGTALRAFFNKPATQDSSVTEALASIHLKPEYLWEDDEETMKPVSEQIAIIKNQMDNLNISTMDQLQIWSKIVGGKMGQQMMKLDSKDIKELTSDIRAADDAGSLAAGTFQTFQSKMKEMTEQGQVAFRQFGEYAAQYLLPLLEIIKQIFAVFSNPYISGTAFVGAISLIGTAINKLRNVFQLLKEEYNIFKQHFLKGDELYSIRPSLERSMRRKGEWKDSKEEREKFEYYASNRRGVGAGVLRNYENEKALKLIEANKASMEDFGALERLKKARSYGDIYETLNLEEVAKFKAINSNSYLRGLIGLDKKGLSSTNYDLATYAIQNDLWKDEYTNYLLDTRDPHSVGDFAKRYGRELATSVLKHMEDTINEQKINPSPIRASSMASNNLLRKQGLMQLFGLPSTPPDNKNTELANIYRDGMNFIDNYFNQGVLPENLSLKDIQNLAIGLNQIPGIRVDRDFLSKFQLEHGHTMSKERARQAYSKGEHGLGVALEAQAKSRGIIPMSEAALLSLLKEVIGLDPKVQSTEFRSFKKNQSENLTGITNAKGFYDAMIHGRGVEFKKMLALSSGMSDFITNIKNISKEDKDSNYKTSEEWLAAMEIFRLDKNDFVEVQRLALQSLGLLDEKWEEVLRFTHKSEKLDREGNKGKPSYINSIMGTKTLSDLKKDIKRIGEDENILIAIGNYAKEMEGRTDFDDFSKLSAIKASYHDMRDAGFATANLGKYDYGKDFKDRNLKLEIPRELAFAIRDQNFYDIFKNLKIGEKTITQFVEELAGKEDAPEILLQMYKDYENELSIFYSNLDKLVEDELRKARELLNTIGVERHDKALGNLKKYKQFSLEFGKILGMPGVENLSKNKQQSDVFSYLSQMTGQLNLDSFLNINVDELKRIYESNAYSSREKDNIFRTVSQLLGIFDGEKGFNALYNKILAAAQYPDLFAAGLGDRIDDFNNYHDEAVNREVYSSPTFEDIQNRRTQAEETKKRAEEKAREEEDRKKKEEEIEKIKKEKEAELDKQTGKDKDDGEIDGPVELYKSTKEGIEQGVMNTKDYEIAQIKRKNLETMKQALKEADEAWAEYTGGVIKNYSDIVTEITGGTFKKPLTPGKSVLDEYTSDDFKNFMLMLPHDIGIEENEKSGFREKLKEKLGLGGFFSKISNANIGDKIRDSLFTVGHDSLFGTAGERSVLTNGQKLGNMFQNVTNLLGGPFMFALEAVTVVIQTVQQAYQDYIESLKKAEEQVSEAFSKVNNAENSLRRVFEENNPEATEEEIDNMVYDTYETMAEDMNNAVKKNDEAYFKKLNLDAKKEDALEYDEEKDDGSLKKAEEEEKTDEEAYEEAIKENTGALYEATAQLNVATSKLANEMLKPHWGIDSGETWFSDMVGGTWDKLFNSDTDNFYESARDTEQLGGTFSSNNNEFLLTDSQKDENYQGYTEMAGLMLENLKDTQGNWVRAMRTMLGRDVELLNNMIPQRSQEWMKSLSMSSRGGLGSLDARTNARLQTSMKNDPKTWKKLAREYAKRDVNAKQGRDTSKNVKRIKGLTQRLSSQVGSGFKANHAMQAAYLVQMQEMYKVAQNTMVPLIDENTQLAGNQLLTQAGIQSTTGNTADNAGGTWGTAEIISGLVAIIAKTKAAEYAHQVGQEADPGEVDAAGNIIRKGTDLNGDGFNKDDRAIIELAQSTSDYKEFQQKANKDYYQGRTQNATNPGRGDALMAPALFIAQMYGAGAKMTGYDYDAKTANETMQKWIKNDLTGKESLSDIYGTLGKNYTENEKFHQRLIDNYINATEEDEGDGSGGGGGGGGGGNSGDKDNTGNKKERVDLVLCNKKEIPKLNVNLFKKPPTFTVLNKNFKLRDVKINTHDKPKAIMASIKNAFIDVQKRSDPKIIQDEEAEYDPVGATDGNSVPSGSSTAKTDSKKNN